MLASNATQPGGLELPSAAVDARARQLARARYAQTSHRFRSLRSTLISVTLLLLSGAGVALPVAAFEGIALELSLGAFGSAALGVVVAAILFHRCGVWSRPYAIASTLAPALTCLASASVIVASGSGWSIYWLTLWVMVLISAGDPFRYRVHAAVLGVAVGGLVVAFAWKNAWADAALCAAIGGCSLAFQRLAAGAAQGLQRQQAHAELLVARGNELVAEREQQRIRERLVQGVAAPLKAISAVTRELSEREPAQVKQLSQQLRGSLEQLREVLDETRSRREQLPSKPPMRWTPAPEQVERQFQTDSQARFELLARRLHAWWATLGVVIALSSAVAVAAVVETAPYWPLVISWGAATLGFLVAGAAWHRLGAQTRGYRRAAATALVSWLAAAGVAIATHGSATSGWWFAMAAAVVVTNPLTHGSRFISRCTLVVVAALVVFFLAASSWGDAALSAIVGGMLIYNQRFVGDLSRRFGHEQALAKVLARATGRVARQQERDRIVRALHDGVAAELTSAVWQARRARAAQSSSIRELATRVDASLAELDRALTGGASESLTAAALAERCDQAGRALTSAHERSVDWSFTAQLADPDRALCPARCDHTLQVVREAVRNALEHAAPTHLGLELTIADEIVVVVRDDGCGFAPEALGRSGTSHIAARARELDGSASWSHEDGGGTRVVFQVPVAHSTRP